MKKCIYHRAANAEYAEAAQYYASIHPELGKRFYHEIERLIEDIRLRPRQFKMFDEPLRRHFSAVFPYAVIYLEEADIVRVVAVMHLRQKPSYWRDRL